MYKKMTDNNCNCNFFFLWSSCFFSRIFQNQAQNMTHPPLASRTIENVRAVDIERIIPHATIFVTKESAAGALYFLPLLPCHSSGTLLWSCLLFLRWDFTGNAWPTWIANLLIVIGVETIILMAVATVKMFHHVVLTTKLTLAITIMNPRIIAMMETRQENTPPVTTTIINKMAAAKIRIITITIIANKMSITMTYTMMQSQWRNC